MSLIRSTLLTARVVSRPAASFASSSRYGLDFTRPRYVSTTTTTTTLIEPQVVQQSEIESEAEAEAGVSVGPDAVESHESPSTSNPRPKAIPTPQPKASVNAAATPGKHTPQFSAPAPAAAVRAKGKGEQKGNRWIVEPALGSGEKSLLPTHTLHVKSTRNNVILSLTDGMGPVFGSVSGGTDRAFKNSQRSSYEAATQAATKMFERVLEWNRGLAHAHRPQIRVSFNGMFGMGREAVSAAMAGPEGQEIRTLITRVEDRTKIKIGGVRAPKPRRL